LGLADFGLRSLSFRECDFPAMSLEHLPQLGTKPVPLTVKMPALKERGSLLTDGIRDMFRKGEFCDVALVVSGQTFLAHRCVLAAQSAIFKQGLEVPPDTAAGAGSRQEVRLAEIANPEAAKFMLDFLYEMDAAVWEEYNPRTQEINKDVLRLAQHFQLPGLTDRAKYWLSKDLHTGNVIERLAICETFQLTDLYQKILEQLTMNKKALAEISGSPQIVQYPSLMQALLQLASGEGKDEPQPKKKAKK